MNRYDDLLLRWVKGRLKAERISRTEFAYGLKMPNETISRIMLGRRAVTLGFVVACIKYFDLTPNEIFGIMGLYKEGTAKNPKNNLSKSDQELIERLTSRLKKR